MSIKGFLKKIFPASAKTSEKYTENLLWKLDRLNDKLDGLDTILTRLSRVEKLEQDLDTKLKEIEETNAVILRSLESGIPLLDLARSTSETVTKLDESLARVEATASDTKKEISSLETKALSSVTQVDGKLTNINSNLDGIINNQSELIAKSDLIIDRAEKTHERAVKAVGNSQEAVWAHVFHDTVKDSEWLKDTSFSREDGRLDIRISMSCIGYLTKSDQKTYLI